MYKNINYLDFKELIGDEGDNLEIIDVREEDEYRVVRVKNSKIFPMGKVLDNLDEIDWNKKVVLICRSGSRSAYVAQLLSNLGKNVTNLSGGIYALELDKCDCLEK